MGWAVVSVAGFLVTTGLVVAMARSNTARWERDHRAAQVAARAHAARGRSVWSATLGRRHAQSEAAARRPHLHLPHVRLPAGLVARLPHPHVPHPHLPHPHLEAVRLPALHLPRRVRRAPEPEGEPLPEAEPQPAGADGDTTGVTGGSG
ncbi:hypothetical protein SAMN04488107_1679 [Geodermatophilus saharensis]|uniref:Uncharacterized protein n=1 Tax=Geodermatophilus saharensis TaxID=1137994 RepID=A0A239CL39_9ACTN|nr:hypothetical protein [Geodermatophilus saharensis]SNS20438.1 hypothetical protein SAMN04488107_1679 [Geodermatophilus saharensis]